MMNSDISALKKMLNLPDNKISLAQATLMVAKIEYPSLDIDRYLQKIQTIAEKINDRLTQDANAAEILKQLNYVLFSKMSYEGNSTSYYDPRNSFLNDVIDRKLGNPISLSILYIALGQTLGLPLSGVAFPGHFLVKLEISDGAIVLDPYFNGISLDEDDIEERLREYYGPSMSKSRSSGVLATCSKKGIVLRVMRNLRNLYMKNNNGVKALPLANLMVDVEDDRLDALKARASIYEQLECSIPALADYKDYLKLSPENVSNHFIRGRVIELAKSASRLC